MAVVLQVASLKVGWAKLALPSDKDLAFKDEPREKGHVALSGADLLTKLGTTWETPCVLSARLRGMATY